MSQTGFLDQGCIPEPEMASVCLIAGEGFAIMDLVAF